MYNLEYILFVQLLTLHAIDAVLAYKHVADTCGWQLHTGLWYHALQPAAYAIESHSGRGAAFECTGLLSFQHACASEKADHVVYSALISTYL